jgi:hypothetical protein
MLHNRRFFQQDILREKICRSAKDSAEKFLVKAKQQARKATEKMFRI